MKDVFFGADDHRGDRAVALTFDLQIGASTWTTDIWRLVDRDTMRGLSSDAKSLGAFVARLGSFCG